MFGCQNGLTEVITKYTNTQAYFSDGDDPLYIVKPVTSLNNLRKKAIPNCQFSDIKESDNVREQRSACNETGELDSVEIEEFNLRESINFLKYSFDSQNYQQQRVIRKHVPCHWKPILKATHQNSLNRSSPTPQSESRIILPNCSKKGPVSPL